MTVATPIHPPALAVRAAGFSLVELLAVATTIAALAGLLVTALSLVREQSRRARAREQVAELHLALQDYAAEDARHRYPPQEPDLTLRAEAAAPYLGNLALLARLGAAVDRSRLDHSLTPPALVDPWHRPYQYQVDSDRARDGAQRPLPLSQCPEWNARGARPWGYVWSRGERDRDDGVGWIYQKDAR